MRTTLDFPDVLAQRAKHAAIRRGITLKALITEAVEKELDAGASRPEGRAIRFPLVHSRKRGGVKLTADEVQAILLREEAAAYEVAQRR